MARNYRHNYNINDNVSVCKQTIANSNYINYIIDYEPMNLTVQPRLKNKMRVDIMFWYGCLVHQICFPPNNCATCLTRDENYVYCHVISRDDVRDAVSKLKSSKIGEDGRFYSDSIIHGTGLLFEYISKLLSAMICHSYASTSFIKSSIIPIPKDARANLTDSDKYSSIAISSLLSKLLDYVIIKQQNISLKTSDYQFGFKPKSSTILCTTMVKETIQYYSENGGKPGHLLLLDARKAFDKVA